MRPEVSRLQASSGKLLCRRLQILRHCENLVQSLQIRIHEDLSIDFDDRLLGCTVKPLSIELHFLASNQLVVDVMILEKARELVALFPLPARVETYHHTQ